MDMDMAGDSLTGPSCRKMKDEGMKCVASSLLQIVSMYVL
jgi:hypothetical protein